MKTEENLLESRTGPKHDLDIKMKDFIKDPDPETDLNLDGDLRRVFKLLISHQALSLADQSDLPDRKTEFENLTEEDKLHFETNEKTY